VNLALARKPGKVRTHAPPPCAGLGAQCRRVRVTLRIGSLEEGVTSLDHESTWLLGHTERISFGELWEGDGDLYVEAVLHIQCKYLEVLGPRARCTAHQFEARAPRDLRPPPQPRRLGGDSFQVVDGMRLARRELPAAPRMLPVLADANPCASAPCRTSDHRRGAACCRDLQIESMCTRDETWLEALVRSRRSPYLCKVSRPGEFSLEAEMISACGFLDDEGIGCTLHGRTRADGRPAKPDLCSEWPPKDRGLHPGCVFAPKRRGRSAG
jgi:hypothetical protein